MQRRNHSKTKKDEELVQVWISKRWTARPFPLLWGIASLALFFAFAVVTQLQFARIADDKIFDARMDVYFSDVRAYDVAVKANIDCLTSIETRETYRGIFSGVSDLFQKTADLPVQFFPLSREAVEYQSSLTQGIQDLISTPVEEKLPPKNAAECPQPPPQEPTRPSR